MLFRSTGTNGYVAYLKKEDLPKFPIEASILTEDQGSYKLVKTETLGEEGMLP